MSDGAEKIPTPSQFVSLPYSRSHYGVAVVLLRPEFLFASGEADDCRTRDCVFIVTQVIMSHDSMHHSLFLFPILLMPDSEVGPSAPCPMVRSLEDIRLT